ncbi:MAG: hypothetical protein JRJ86_00370 [Deltaproteobacteria bacterium]|nr:hypothetical protein [Deltaproteobacteria bacterium]MBW2117639.1 hypothetical protein [Deltaproteobacteria bacterium]MBW2342761.1 hypothetical protein [Deltaproteobacteria bacterium]
MDIEKEHEDKTIQERIAEEDLIKERIDETGNKWEKVYFGGGQHFENWLEQCKELGEVMVEEVDSTGYKCYEKGGEKLYRIWMKMNESKEDDLY